MVIIPVREKARRLIAKPIENCRWVKEPRAAALRCVRWLSSARARLVCLIVALGLNAVHPIAAVQPVRPQIRWQMSPDINSISLEFDRTAHSARRNQEMFRWPPKEQPAHEFIHRTLLIDLPTGRLLLGLFRIIRQNRRLSSLVRPTSSVWTLMRKWMVRITI